MGVQIAESVEPKTAKNKKDMLNPLDTSLFNYYNSAGKNINEFILDNETTLHLDRPAISKTGYSFEIKAKLKHGLFTHINNSDRHFWIWGTPKR